MNSWKSWTKCIKTRIHTCEKPAEVISCLHHCLVSRDVPHRAERVVRLRSADPRNHIHGQHIQILRCQLLHKFWILFGVYKTDESWASFEVLYFAWRWCSDLENDVTFESVLFRNNFGSCWCVLVIENLRFCSCIVFYIYIVTFLNQVLDGGWS